MTTRVAGSFRDPSGYIFRSGSRILRHVAPSYAEEFDTLHRSGLYQSLVDEGLLVVSPTVGYDGPEASGAHVILEPEKIDLISYPYEWSFSQLKDAAALTLRIAMLAIEKGMALKDASAYNVQFLKGKPVFIDTLSFERYVEGEPWVAYGQFCRHFLAPLALMAHCDIRLSVLLRDFIDGIPLELTSKLLPSKTKFSALALHIHTHARVEKSTVNAAVGAQKGRGVGKNALLGILDSLQGTIKGLHWSPEGTEWGDYYSDTNYGPESFKAKHKLVAESLEKVRPSVVWDIGANTGEFSRIAAGAGANVVAWDIDPAAVEKHYLNLKTHDITSTLPLLLDLTNPSPSIGWANSERETVAERSNADVCMALALIHHLAIGNNVPLDKISDYFATLAPNLIIEFVPKNDSQVLRMMQVRKDVFPNYTIAGFEQAFGQHWEIVEKQSIPDTQRTLYLLKKR